MTRVAIRTARAHRRDDGVDDQRADIGDGGRQRARHDSEQRDGDA